MKRAEIVSIGGKARMASMTQDERREFARDGANKRWKKSKMVAADIGLEEPSQEWKVKQ